MTRIVLMAICLQAPQIPLQEVSYSGAVYLIKGKRTQF